MSLGIRKGILWTFVGQISYLGVTLISTIVLARILSPSEFGKYGTIFFFIVISRVLIESGFGGALIRNNNAKDIDYSTIFIFNLVLSIILCSLLIISSGYIANFYKDQSLKKLITVSSFILIINSFQFVQSTKLVMKMRFYYKAIYEFIAVLISSIIGICLAINGYGVWSLVIIQLLTSLNLLILFWVFEGGHGPILFSKKSFLFYYKFGSNTTLTSIINTFFDNFYQLILSKYFSYIQTGLYYQAKKIQDIPFGIINSLTQNVLYSGLSKIQDDKSRFKQNYQFAIRLFTIFVGFICLYLFLFAKEIILLLLGEQWLDCVFFLKILTIIGFFNLQEKFNRVLFKIFNNTKFILYLELVKKTILIFTIFLGLNQNSLEFLMYGFLITSIFSYLINYYYTYKFYKFLGINEFLNFSKVILILLIIGYSFTHLYQFNFLFKSLISLLLYFGLIFSLKLLSINDLLKLKYVKKSDQIV